MSRVTVYIKPGSKKPGVIANEDGTFTVRVRQPARDGLANEALIHTLAAEWKIPPSHIKIQKGFKSKIKLIELL